MQPSTFLTYAALTVAVSAKCFGGSNKRPDHGLEVIEFFYAAGCDLQSEGKLKAGKEFKRTSKSTDGKCLNVLVKNHGNNDMQVSSNQAVDAWAREWVGCEHGGKTEYGDKLEYIWHLDC